MFFVKLSFQEWTQQVQDMLNTKKFGDIAFRDKDFKNAIEYYSKVLLEFLLLDVLTLFMFKHDRILNLVTKINSYYNSYEHSYSDGIVQ